MENDVVWVALGHKAVMQINAQTCCCEEGMKGSLVLTGWRRACELRDRGETEWGWRVSAMRAKAAPWGWRGTEALLRMGLQVVAGLGEKLRAGMERSHYGGFCRLPGPAVP